MIFADADVISFTAAGLTMLGVLSMTIVGLVGTLLKILYDNQMKSQDARVKAVEDSMARLLAENTALLADKDKELASYRSGYFAAVKGLQIAADRYTRDQGGTPLAGLAPVVPEHHSPPTEGQVAAADLETLKAAAAAAVLALDIDPSVLHPIVPQPVPDPRRLAMTALEIDDSLRIAGHEVAAAREMLQAASDAAPTPPDPDIGELLGHDDKS